MTTQTEALKLALEALTIADNIALVGAAYTPRSIDLGLQKISSAITAIKEALAQPEQELTNLERHERNVQQLFGTPQPKEPEQEPVAWGNLANWCLDSDRVLITDKDEAAKYHRDVYDLTPLYTSPPQRTWIWLTDSEKYALSNDVAKRGVPVFEAICEAEAKLKEKNT